MTSADVPTHLLSLKVMRVSRPEPASGWQPFYSNSPSFSAHSSASIFSLQGSTPLTGHPKTLRDLTHASELLNLPAAFGSIQLGETFSCCLCVNNEATSDIDPVGLKVEIQTANSKLLLAEFGGINHRLRIGDSLEGVVSHEIKELGQHVLACTVTYRLPSDARGVPGADEEPNDPRLQTFRKFYKFVVSNPLSVKTKVHASKAPSAMMDAFERDKVFLEIHVQNVGQRPLHFEQMQFECAENWEATDGNVMDNITGQESIFSGSSTLIQPQDTRQYVYILTPMVVTLFPIASSPGSVVPLGRLNISWRSPFGEPGRLLTSMLSRRIPAAPQQQQVSALPAYLKRTIGGNHPSRPQSPLLPHSRPSSPPAHGATSPLGVLTRPTPQVLSSGVEVALLIRHIPRNEIVVEKPFSVKLALVTSKLGLESRTVRFAVQHLQPPRDVPGAASEHITDAPSPRLSSSGVSTPTSAVGGFNYAVAHQKLLSISRSSTMETEKPSRRDEFGVSKQSILPAPCSEGTDESGLPTVAFVGPSTILLPEVTLGTEILGDSDGQQTESHFVQEFEVTYVPLRKGFIRFGGLRLLLVEDRVVNTMDGDETPILKIGQQKRIQGLREWNIVGEVWAAS